MRPLVFPKSPGEGHGMLRDEVGGGDDDNAGEIREFTHPRECNVVHGTGVKGCDFDAGAVVEEAMGREHAKDAGDFQGLIRWDRGVVPVVEAAADEL